MNRKNPSAKKLSSPLEKNVIIIEKPKYVCILNYTNKSVIIRQKETPVQIDYIEEIFPAIFSYTQRNKPKNKTVSCVWTLNEGYLIEFNINIYQFVRERIQIECQNHQAYFKSLVKRIIVSRLTKLENILYQHHFQLDNIFEVNNMLWTNRLPDDCKNILLCQVPAASPILTLGKYHKILLDQCQININLPVQSSFTENFVQYIIQQNDLKKIITHSKDLIPFLMYFKMGFYIENGTKLTMSDFIWKNYRTVSIMHEEEFMIKNIDFRKLYFIQDKLDILNLITAAITILGLFLLDKSITVEQT